MSKSMTRLRIEAVVRGLSPQDLAGGEGPLPHGRTPAGVGRHLDLGEHGVDHPVEDVLLVGHVLVQRHRHHAQLLGKLPHAQRLDS